MKEMLYSLQKLRCFLLRSIVDPEGPFQIFYCYRKNINIQYRFKTKAEAA